MRQYCVHRRKESNGLPQVQRITENDSFDSTRSPKETSNLSRPPPPPPPPPNSRRYSSAAEEHGRKARPSLPATSAIASAEEFAEDTMGNLKKTFAGIFGDV